MDFLGVKNTIPGKKANSTRRNSKKDLKVTYISSPIKVQTSAAEFRSLVQELTGKDSDIAESHFIDWANNDGAVDHGVRDRTGTMGYPSESSVWVGSGLETWGSLPEMETNGSYMDMLSSGFLQQESCFGSILGVDDGY